MAGSTSPFKFLDSYTKEDKDIFFGRDKEIEELYSKVFESKLILVYGASGTGKSSLINCGLANKFEDSDWLPVNVRRGNNINSSLAQNINSQAITPVKAKGSLNKSIQSLYLDHFKPVYFIFDQFEELFIFGTVEERSEFITSIKAILEEEIQCRFIFVLRGEYLENIAEFENVIPDFFENRIRIEKMTRTGAIECITGPCNVHNIEVEEDFAPKLLEKLSPDKAEIELTYLQVFLDKLYKESETKDASRFTLKMLTDLGRIGDVLSDFLEEQISILPDSETGLTILKAFVSLRGTKKQIGIEEIKEFTQTLGKDIPDETIESNIHQFVDLRILRDKDDNDKYELRHDSLASKIYEKITLLEKELLEVRQFLYNSYEEYTKRQIFLRADDLKYIAPYENKLFLNESITDFITVSKKEISRAKQRKRNIVIVLSLLLLVIFAGFTIWALRERSKAIELNVVAELQKNEALVAKENAINAKEEALEANEKAVKAQKRSEENENLALIAKNQADVAKQQALLLKDKAVKSSLFAVQQTQIAKEEATKADEQRQLAEELRVEAEIASNKAKRLSYLAIAQSLAFKATLKYDDHEVNGLLALQAYKFNDRYGGYFRDPLIYEALSTSYKKIDNSSNVLKISTEQVSSFVIINDSLIRVICANGELISYNFKTAEKDIVKLNSSVPINTAYFNEIGTMLVVGYEDKTVKLWDLKGSKAVSHKLKGHTGLIRSVAFHSNGEIIATAGRDKKIMFWDISKQSQEPIKVLKLETRIRAIDFSKSGNMLVSGGEDGNVILWHLPNYEEQLIAEHSARILSLKISHKNDYAIIGYSDGVVLVYDVVNRTKVNELKVSNVGIELINVHHSQGLVAIYSSDKKIRIYALADMQKRPLLIKGYSDRMNAIAFNKTGQVFAVGRDNNVRFWESDNKVIADRFCKKLGRNLTLDEWNVLIGEDIQYENTCADK